MGHYRLQDARTVLYRTLSLGALLKRGEYELTLQNLTQYPLPPDVREHIVDKHFALNNQLLTWVIDEGIKPYLSDPEILLLRKPMASWTEREVIQTSWRIESLGMLMWSLGILDDIPHYDTQFEPDMVLQPIEIMEPTIDLLWRANLRPFEEIIELRDMAELWHWRSRTTQVVRMGAEAPAGITFAEIIQLAAEKAYADGGIPQPIDGDFPVFGKAYATIDDDQYALTASIAAERHFALNWLCGFSDDWEKTPTDV